MNAPGVFTKASAGLALFAGLAFSGTVYNTGVSADGRALTAPGSQDVNYPYSSISTCCSQVDNYVATSAQIAAGSYNGASSWIADTSTAQWIEDGVHSGANFGFETTFTLTQAEIDAGGISLSGEIAMSGLFVAIDLNGESEDGSAAFSEDYGTALHPFDITSGFQVGTNTLIFSEQWTNSNQVNLGNANVGIMVDDMDLTGAPEPGAWLLLALSLAAVGCPTLVRRARSRRVSVSQSN